MSAESKLEVLYVDEKTKKVERLSGKDLTDQLEKLKKALEYVLRKMQRLGDYELSEFTATAGVELGAWIFKVDGAIQMKWEKL